MPPSPRAARSPGYRRGRRSTEISPGRRGCGYGSRRRRRAHRNSPASPAARLWQNRSECAWWLRRQSLRSGVRVASAWVFSLVESRRIRIMYPGRPRRALNGPVSCATVAVGRSRRNRMSVAFEIEIVPTGTVGAEMRGVDLASVNEAQVEAIKGAWYRHDVLVFRDQEMTDDDLLAFSRHFGTLDPPPNQGAGRKSPPGYPDIYVISNVLDQKGEPIGALGDGDAAWHTDMSYIAQPPDASMLYSLEIPARGGDTWFCGMKAALAKMPKSLLERIRTLDIKHDGTYDSGGYVRKGLKSASDPRTSVGTPHPVVIQHPVSGEPALYLGRRRNAYVMGLELAESERLLDEIWRYVETALYRHRWALGDLVLWDNRTTMHRRDAFDPKARRVMHRTQIKGSGAPRRPTRSGITR